MFKKVVGVLRGGPSAEYEVSLKTGRTVLEGLPKERYDVRDIFIDREGVWHVRGVPVEPARALDQVDVVFNALHGAYGEDGTVQRLLDTHRVPYTGSDAFSSAVGMNKPLAKKGLRPSGMAFAAHAVLSRDDCGEEMLRSVFHTLSPPYVVKPAKGGSSYGVSIVQTFDELLFAVLSAFEHGDTILVEQYVRGREVTVGVAEGFRGEELYAFPPIEIVPTKSVFFDYDEKYSGHARELCPAPLPREMSETLMGHARFVHKTLGLRDYSRSDFIVARDGVYFLEVNTLPGLTEASLIPKALSAVGGSLPLFLEHLVTRALARARR